MMLEKRTELRRTVSPNSRRPTIVVRGCTLSCHLLDTLPQASVRRRNLRGFQKHRSASLTSQFGTRLSSFFILALALAARFNWLYCSC
mmetsp:Transcript_27457/g.88726  ORF Transcript_27457/g.88726 Transcript_27457/m.88726 type:complete len:88 (+) Transcript_27457:220-483(+)